MRKFISLLFFLFVAACGEQPIETAVDQSELRLEDPRCSRQPVVVLPRLPQIPGCQGIHGRQILVEIPDALTYPPSYRGPILRGQIIWLDEYGNQVGRTTVPRGHVTLPPGPPYACTVLAGADVVSACMHLTSPQGVNVTFLESNGTSRTVPMSRLNFLNRPIGASWLVGSSTVAPTDCSAYFQ